MKPELAPPHANRLILSPCAWISCLLVPWGSGWCLPSPPLLAAVLTSKDCALCPAALGSQPSETLLQPRGRLITHLATPLFRGRRCHVQLPLRNLSCPMEGKAVKGPKSQALQEVGGGGSLSLRQGPLFCQEQPSAPEKEPGKIYKALWAEFLDILVALRWLSVFSERWAQPSLMRTNTFNKKETSQGPQSVGNSPWDVIRGILLKTLNLGIFSPSKLLGILTSGDDNFCLKLSLSWLSQTVII